MNTREQLIGIERELGESGTLHLSENTAAQWRKVVKQLIAERPYEPGETILVGRDVDELLKYPMKRKYIASWRDKVIVESQTSGVDVWPYSFHKPLPKTYRLKPVPEEIMETAQEIISRHRQEIKTDHVSIYRPETSRLAEWLADPKNWEADDE